MTTTLIIVGTPLAVALFVSTAVVLAMIFLMPANNKD